MLAFKSGDIQLIYLIIGNPDIARQINEGEVKGLLVQDRGESLVPDVPSFAEAGLSGDQSAFETWFGMFAPRGTPAEIVKKLNAELSAIVKTPAFAKEYLLSKGFEPVGEAAKRSPNSSWKIKKRESASSTFPARSWSNDLR